MPRRTNDSAPETGPPVRKAAGAEARVAPGATDAETAPGAASAEATSKAAGTDAGPDMRRTPKATKPPAETPSEDAGDLPVTPEDSPDLTGTTAPDARRTPEATGAPAQTPSEDAGNLPVAPKDSPDLTGTTAPDAGSGPGTSGETRVGSSAEAASLAGAAEDGVQGDGVRGASRDLPGTDPRVAAVRRVSQAGRRWRMVRLGGCAALLAVALTAGAIAVEAARDGGHTAVASASSVPAPESLTSGDLDTSITALQAHLRSQPKDFGGWATLGLAYVEQARTKGDPSRYPQAERALKRSLELRADNDQALAGQAALAAARHDFKGALDHADQALARNPYSERALSSRIDALVELGRYQEAAAAADLADSRRPGIPVFTRYAYVHELRGDVKTARRVLEQALASATTPGDLAYVSTALGQLAWNQGQYKTALHHYARALAADETYLPALEGRARTQAASGDRAAAIKGMEAVVARLPLPGPLVELGELYEDRDAKGDRAKAHDQYALVDAWIALARANKVNADLDTAMAAADHGDKAAALRAAGAEWARRHTVHTADALAWALHVNGRDDEALPYARKATATGYRNAAFLYHRGMIERATGHAEEARTHLTAALELNPGFSPLGAREARTALEATR